MNDQSDSSPDSRNAPTVPGLRSADVDPSTAVEHPTFQDVGNSPSGKDATHEWRDLLEPPTVPGDLGAIGPYRITALLGKGGMGYVLEGIDSQLQRPVALKILNQKVAWTKNAAERFLREARALASVSNDHVVTIYQVGRTDSTPYLAMERLAGCTLAQYLEKQNRVGVDQILRIGRETAEGLAATHEKGLVHRDVKPGNLWLCEKSLRLKILDFGLARGFDEDQALTQAGSVVGTPQFMSPEQAEGAPVDGRADLFSLGCLLYLLCTGKNAFDGNSPLTVLHKLANHRPAPTIQVNAEIPLPLSDLIEQLLEKNPVLRPRSASEVARRLAEIETELADGRAGSVLRPAPPETPVPAKTEAGDAVREPAEAGSWRAGWWGRALAIMGFLLLLLLVFLAFRPPPPPHERPWPPTWSGAETEQPPPREAMEPPLHGPHLPPPRHWGPPPKHRPPMREPASSGRNKPFDDEPY